MAELLKPLFVTLLDSNGKPVSAGYIKPLHTGTTTPAPVYADAGLTTPAPTGSSGFPQADSAGRLRAIYLDPSITYRIQVFNADGSMVDRGDVDPANDTTFATFIASLSASSGAGLIGYIRNATGAIARTVADWFDDQPSVMDFIPFSTRVQCRMRTATADVSSYLQAAIDSVQTSGLALKVPSASYPIANTLNITSPIKLYGDGNRTSVLKPNGSFDAINTTALSGAGLEIRDIGIINTLPSNTATAGCGIRVRGASYGNIENIQIDNCYRGVYVSNFNFSRLTGVTVNGFVDSGLKLDGGFNSKFDTVTVSGNDTGLYCAHVSEGNDKHLFTNCNFSTGVYPLYITATVYNTSTRLEFSKFDSCSFDSSLHGAFIEKCTAIVFDSCFFSNRPLNGCDVGTAATTENITFLNCDFFNNGVHGMVWGLFAEEVQAIGCKFVDNGAAAPGTYDGLHINDGCSGWEVIACNFRNAWGGTGSQLHGLNIAGANCNNFLVALNKFGPSVSQPFNNLSTSADQNIFGNLGYRTHASGSIALVAGAATVPLVVNFPAATYQLSLSCNANETIHWVPGSKAVDGFAIASSNAGSTATVDWVATLSKP